VDIAAGNAVTANDDNAVNAVASLSSTKDEDAYVGRRWHSKARASAHSRTVPLPPTSRCRAAATAAASVLLPLRCRCRAVRRRCASCCCHRCWRRHADANVALLRCRHRRSLCAAATALPCASRSEEYAVLSAYSVLSRNDISKFMQWEYLSGIFVPNLLNLGFAERLIFLWGDAR
jgi:hypothetical protein